MTLLGSQRAHGLAAACLLPAVLLATGCAPSAPERTARDGRDIDRSQVGQRSPSPAAAPATEPAAPAEPVLDAAAYAVTASSSAVTVHSAPDGPSSTTLASPLPSGAPLTFLLVQRRGPWLEVLLPIEPNGSTGWVRDDAVVLEAVPYRLDVLTAQHRLELFEDGELVKSFPVAIGKASTPTPGGLFYLKELLQPPDPAGSYGPYAYGLSGYSTALDSFAGADVAVIGIHGTNQPGSVGKDVSSGCIRMRNADISELVGLLPLGTPVRILA